MAWSDSVVTIFTARFYVECRIATGLGKSSVRLSARL